ncbi:hypothetical protein CALVIDRAFT_567283 [Calocera viscosa TUFC12733]|uniref:MYND-type domain-containing protein n=1 Tax=Calocera viscosa (strain TUFC12733) TaxID=1330018 RepID=A0A167IG03_CALVF|nr:hypothetical protein CALVIDRAFT_567283 [Calocera viscosa TUFC12733]
MFGGGGLRPTSAFVHTTLMGSMARGERMAIDFNVPCDVEALRSDRDAQAKFISSSIKQCSPELKYSADWTCFACGDPAHEVVHNPMSWLHAQPAFVMDYVHFVCRLSKDECRKVVDESNAELSREMGMEPPTSEAEEPAAPVEKPPVEDGPSEEPVKEAGPAQEKDSEKEKEQEGPAGGCAVCHKLGKMLQCSRCKLIRYCSPECQKADYGRHKTVCRWVDNVEKTFPAEKKEGAGEGETEKPAGDGWPASIPRPFDPAPPKEHDHSNC